MATDVSGQRQAPCCSEEAERQTARLATTKAGAKMKEHELTQLIPHYAATLKLIDEVHQSARDGFPAATLEDVLRMAQNYNPNVE